MPVSIGEVQARIGQIHSLMLAASSTGAGPAQAAAVRAAGGTATATAGMASTSGTDFAAALDSAVTATGTATAADGWVRPTNGSVSSGFGPRWGTQHEGIDIAAASGTPVRAATDGVVKKASWYGGYGNAVIIDHGGGVKTLYGHNSALTVKPGDRVQAGEVIAKVGSTGDSTGPHLHFEVQVDGKAINPRPWLKKHGLSL
jgi:murein DD-endopeptidase MepM/ murein hydrolase activator NlpD